MQEFMNLVLRLLLLLVLASSRCFAQNKAYVLQNSWVSTLNSYNPAPFYDQVFPLLQNRLKVDEINRNPLSQKLNPTEEECREMISKHVKENTGNAYYIVLSNDLSLPLVNLTRIIFKVPTRSSRLVFTINVYNNKGEKTLSDTIVNRGCIVRVINDDKIKNFYPNYATFLHDIQCHFITIRKEFQKMGRD